MTITITMHAPLVSFRRSRARCTCTCGWQTDWLEETRAVREEWAKHVEREQRYRASEQR